MRTHIFLLMTSFVLGACNHDFLALPCQNGYIVVGEVCRQTCTTSAECALPLTCLGSVCVPSGRSISIEDFPQQSGGPTLFVDTDQDGISSEIDCDDQDENIGLVVEVGCQSACASGISRCIRGETYACDAPTDCGCAAGDTRKVSCEMCGVQEQVCDSDGGWSNSGTCELSGMCSPGDVERGDSCGNCGFEIRFCTATCEWGEWSCSDEGVCAPDAVQSEQQLCDNCNQKQERSRTCQSNCEYGPWTEWGTCNASSACEPGTQNREERRCGPCGSGVQTRTQLCDEACGWNLWTEWSTCEESVGCQPDDVIVQRGSCGPCGSGMRNRIRTCDAACNWMDGPWSQCIQASSCVPPSIAVLDPISGLDSGGTPVSIHGSGFSGGGEVSVRFGGVPSSTVTVVNDRLIRTLSPPSSRGAVTVSIINDKGATKLDNAFEFLPTGGPGSDGSPVFTGGSHVVNPFWGLEGAVQIGDRHAVLRTAIGQPEIYPGHKLLFINVNAKEMKDVPGLGAWTIVTVSEVKLDFPKEGQTFVGFTSPYNARAPAVIDWGTYVVRIMQYQDVVVPPDAVLTARNLSLSTGGGIVAFEATGKVVVRGAIDMTGRGYGLFPFRPDEVQLATIAAIGAGAPGQGGTFATTENTGGEGGGGGQGSENRSRLDLSSIFAGIGGGGGGNGASGSRGFLQGTTDFLLTGPSGGDGGGEGGGDSADGGTGNPGTVGGGSSSSRGDIGRLHGGGGIILIWADSIEGEGVISANGREGEEGEQGRKHSQEVQGNGGGGGGGGGGSGGFIGIAAQSVTVKLEANGGNGGAPGAGQLNNEPSEKDGKPGEAGKPGSPGVIYQGPIPIP